jgi:hypothetical protein
VVEATALSADERGREAEDPAAELPSARAGDDRDLGGEVGGIDVTSLVLRQVAGDRQRAGEVFLAQRSVEGDGDVELLSVEQVDGLDVVAGIGGARRERQHRSGLAGVMEPVGDGHSHREDRRARRDRDVDALDRAAAGVLDRDGDDVAGDAHRDDLEVDLAVAVGRGDQHRADGYRVPESGALEAGKLCELRQARDAARLCRKQIGIHHAAGPGSFIETEDMTELVTHDRHQVHPVGGPAKTCGVAVYRYDLADRPSDRCAGEVIDENNGHAGEVGSGEDVAPLAHGGEEGGVQKSLSELTASWRAASGSRLVWVGWR